jgi:hypothetical protein
LVPAGGQAQKRLRWAALAVFLGGFLGLCTLFAAVVTVARKQREVLTFSEPKKRLVS